MSISSITDIRQYLTFQLGKEVFALDVCNVREILEFANITKVPKTPEIMRGVINLRGSVVPVLDVRLKFGLTRTEKTIDTCIIVVEVSFEEENMIIGALVDSVQEVFDLEPDQIEPAPRFGTQLKTEFIKGMGKRDDHFIILLDIDKVFTSEELAVVTGSETEKKEDSIKMERNQNHRSCINFNHWAVSSTSGNEEKIQNIGMRQCS